MTPQMTGAPSSAAADGGAAAAKLQFHHYHHHRVPLSHHHPMPASLLSKLAFWSVCSLLLLLAFLRLFPCFVPALCATLEPPHCSLHASPSAKVKWGTTQ